MEHSPTARRSQLFPLFWDFQNSQLVTAGNRQAVTLDFADSHPPKGSGKAPRKLCDSFEVPHWERGCLT